jgi:hypothetical protein
MENAFLDRLKVEKDELLEKVTKLARFLNSDLNDLSEANFLLLKQQLEAMNTYLNILIVRVELLEK